MVELGLVPSGRGGASLPVGSEAWLGQQVLAVGVGLGDRWPAAEPMDDAAWEQAEEERLRQQRLEEQQVRPLCVRMRPCAHVLLPLPAGVHWKGPPLWWWWWWLVGSGGGVSVVALKWLNGWYGTRFRK